MSVEVDVPAEFNSGVVAGLNRRKGIIMDVQVRALCSLATLSLLDRRELCVGLTSATVAFIVAETPAVVSQHLTRVFFPACVRVRLIRRTRTAVRAWCAPTWR
jgi:hypothetical protein